MRHPPEYTASVNGSGVQLSNDNGTNPSTGVFVNRTPSTSFQDAGWANGNNLAGFDFTFTNSKLEANQTAAGFFSYHGLGDPEEMLRATGFQYHFLGFDFGGDEFRSAGAPTTGANSGHFIVDTIAPKLGVPYAIGDMHFGEHNPFAGPEAAWEHIKEQQ